MAVKASTTVTITAYRDTKSVTRYYKLVSATASAPSKPTANPPDGWTDTEPSYTSGSTDILYFCDLTVFSNDEWEYSSVSKSSSYEAAKQAYNKAQSASDTATAAKDSIDNLEIGGRNLLLSSADLTKWRIEGGTYCTLQDDGYFKIEKPGLANSRFGIYCFLTLEPNTTYSFSADVKDICCFGVQKSTTPEPSAWGNAIIYESTSRYKNTEFIKTGEDDYYVKIYIYHRGGDPCSYVKLPKLEKGNRATDWTPAPEDVDAGISDAQSTADTAKSNAAAAQIAANTANTTANAARDKILSWCHENNQTLIDGAKIYTGSIDAESINVESLTADAVFIDEMETNLTRFKAVGENEYYETEITGEGIDFKYGTSEETAKTIAGISGDELQIKKTSVLDEMKIGKWSWKVNPNNSHLTLRWNGGDDEQ